MQMPCREDLRTGVPVIDDGHLDLVLRLDNLRSAIRMGVCRFIIEDTLAFLEDYTRLNFCLEEQYMVPHDYAGRGEHMEQHARFAEELQGMQEELRNIQSLGISGSYELSVETVKMIEDWIRDHVKAYDRELGAFLGPYDLDHDAIASPCAGLRRSAQGIITICSICHGIICEKGIRKGQEHPGVAANGIIYSHGLCSRCLQSHYEDLF